MDKQTLSNYGWIAICILVLSVLIAMATPFGKFIEAGVKSTVQGLFDVSDSSMNVGLSSVGIKNTYDCGHERTEPGEHSKKECGHYACENCGCVPATCGISGHWSGDGKDHAADDRQLQGFQSKNKAGGEGQQTKGQRGEHRDADITPLRPGGQIVVQQ